MQFESKYGMNLDYMKIEELPSHFRFYNTNEVYIRGLNLIEVEALSKYLESLDVVKNLEELVRIYEDVIKGIDIKELELIDFSTLLMLISTLTYDGFKGGEFEVNCINQVENPLKEEYIDKIENLKKELKDCETEEDIEQKTNEIIRLEKELAELPNIVTCGNPLRVAIEIFDFEFKDPKIKEPIEFQNMKIKALNVQDVLEIEKFKREKKLNHIQEKAIFLASYIKDKFLSLEEAFNYVLYKAKLKEIKELEKIDDLLTIDIEPIKRRCLKCGYENKLYIGLNDLKVLP